MKELHVRQENDLKLVKVRVFLSSFWLINQCHCRIFPDILLFVKLILGLIKKPVPRVPPRVASTAIACFCGSGLQRLIHTTRQKEKKSALKADFTNKKFREKKPDPCRRPRFISRKLLKNPHFHTSFRSVSALACSPLFRSPLVFMSKKSSMQLFSQLAQCSHRLETLSQLGSLPQSATEKFFLVTPCLWSMLTEVTEA